ncbi:MAG: putative addiction module antidote protein [Deltaproteobacteria bacterium]|nr:putative addiction module antidote protein [Deltaproteobacteria bacterium]
MPVVPYRTSDYLKTPEAIAEYLNVVLEDPDSDHEDLLIALRNVAEAVGGVSELSRRTGLNRSGLSRALSTKNIPKIDTVHKIAKACGVRLQFSACA